MSESGDIGAKGPMVRTSLEWIQWMRKHPPAWVCETYLDMNREKNEEMDSSNNNKSRTSAWSISTTTPSPTSLKTELYSENHHEEAYLFCLADTRLSWSLR